MAQQIAQQWRSFWHTMTSNDRHASHDSPYRTGRHIPLPQSRHAPLTSITTSGIESRLELNSPYAQEEPPTSNGFINSPRGPLSPSSPYSPGLRSTLSRQATADSETFDKSPSGEIPMQNFADGLPPAPPVGHSWKRIDRWAEDRYEELFDNLCEGATSNDVNELEHELDATLPMDVRESLQIHDGQERGGLPTGIIFGCMLLDCEEIVMEWQNWRKVSEEYLTQKPQFRTPQIPAKAFASSSTAPPVAQASQATNPLWRQDLLARQDSQPPNAAQKAYSHPAWIPLARDWGGNYLATDLAPGPAGTWGQIIIYGRDYDCKYVVAKSWGALLAMVADDLSSDKVHIDEDSGELKLMEFKKRQNVEPPYLEILRWRTDQKYGRRGPKRQSKGPSGLKINSNVPNGVASGSAASSPYASPISVMSGTEERGRSPHRLSQKPKGVSPRANISSPLARVAEEKPQPVRVHTGLDAKVDTPIETLVSIDTPRPSEDGKITTPRTSIGSDKENKEKTKSTAPSVKSPIAENAEMKTVEI